MPTDLSIRPAPGDDYGPWLALWRGYCAALGGDVSEAITEGVWHRMVPVAASLSGLLLVGGVVAYGIAGKQPAETAGKQLAETAAANNHSADRLIRSNIRGRRSRGGPDRQDLGTLTNDPLAPRSIGDSPINPAAGGAPARRGAAG